MNRIRVVFWTEILLVPVVEPIQALGADSGLEHFVRRREMEVRLDP